MLQRALTGRTRRLWLAAAVLALGAAAVVGPSLNDRSEAAGQTFPADVAVKWTNLSVAAGKPATVAVTVSAFGRPASEVKVTGNVQICEDMRCYGAKKALNGNKATLTADVPRDASGFKSLSVVFSKGTATLPDGSKFGLRDDFGQAIEGTVAAYSSKATLASKKVSRKKPNAKVVVKGYGRTLTQYSYSTGKASAVKPPMPTGSVTIYRGSKKIGTAWLKGKTYAMVGVSKLGKGTKTVKIKYSGDNYYNGYTIAKAKITVK